MTVRVLEGDCRDVLRGLPDESVQMVCTSPHYFGLRDYGTARWEGGVEGCEHKPRGALGGGTATVDAGTIQRDCHCGATRVDSQLGLERSPDEYVAAMVAVFREVRRVLRADGTLWLNLGDSYANDGKWGGTTGGKHVTALHGESVGRGKRLTGLKPKDLVGIPWMLAFALRSDGWYLRSDIIWHKPNPMPESVTDRPTKAHEQIFLLAKSERYFYDADAIAEDATNRAPGNVSHKHTAAYEGGDEYSRTKGGLLKIGARETRNARTVWTIATAPYSGGHFATFPPKLIEPCVLAGSRKGDTVLDPFFGAGTTGLVADRLGRDCIGIELNPEYAAMARARIQNDNPLFTDVA